MYFRFLEIISCEHVHHAGVGYGLVPPYIGYDLEKNARRTGYTGSATKDTRFDIFRAIAGPLGLDLL